MKTAHRTHHARAMRATRRPATSVLCLLAAALCLLALAPATARADKLFGVEAITTSGTTIVAQNSSLPKLLEQVVSSSGMFNVLGSANYTSSITYLGIAGTILVEMDGNKATITIPLISFTETFGLTSLSREATYDLVKDYFTKNGKDVYGRLMKEMVRASAVAITDGNPNALTANMANTAFVNDGLTPVPDLVDALDAAGVLDGGATGAGNAAGIMDAAGGVTHRGFTGLGVGLNSGQFKAGDFRGSYTDLTAPLRCKINDMLSFAGTFALNYLVIEGSKVYGFGLGAALPVRFQAMSKENPWNWRLTPALGLSARGSADMACGALIFMAGATNTVDYRVNPKLILSLVNYAGFFTSTTLGLPQDFNYDPRVQQILFKNGIRAVTPLDTAKRFILDGFIIETNFAKAATVRGYTTIGASLQWKATRKNYITFGANYDFGKNYTSWSLGLGSVWKF